MFAGIEPAADPVAGGINASWGYQSGLLVAVYRFGAGEFILNSLLIRDHLGKVPQAERLLRNLLRCAARDTARGQSLVVWAIREGRQAARGIDAYLMGSTDLP